MREAEKGNPMHAKGMSLDIVPSPYLLPPGLHGSRESLHSLSRSVIGDDDKYRHATSFLGDNASVRSQPRGYHDDAMTYSRSQSKVSMRDDMNQGLLQNAQRMSRSSPPLYNTPPDGGSVHSPVGQDRGQDSGLQLNLPRSLSPVHIPGFNGSRGPSPVPTSPEGNDDKLPSNLRHGDMQEQSAKNATNIPPKLHIETTERPNFPLQDPLPPHLDAYPGSNQMLPVQTPRISLPVSDAASDYSDHTARDSSIPVVNVHGIEGGQKHEPGPGHIAAPPIPDEPSQSQKQSLDVRRDTRRFTLGLRPLPPEDPSDNPEQRANRIRSFYKEYFDDGKTGRETHYEDFGPETYSQGGYIYDSVTGDYYDSVPAPFAEPVTRRAMTPPPRAPPRFQGAARHMASGSMGGAGDYPGPRAFSSASNRLPGPRAPRKPMPPPSPLQVLPSPHLLKDDSIMIAAEYAPGRNIKDQREGRAETPLGGVRAFTPLPVHTPLASVFDELTPMPSPHALRKSGAFDILDFAPPPRFKNAETASDAGSIRSTSTGISATHLHNIRTGAYRVSRLPPGTVGTRDDLMSNLRPTWDMQQT
ncbi:uncharacterized protein ACLA_045330 [Aspergillus clavatus NRRL 1]|uniref:Uncharacterized protein n=1 Tax=Aspergillus clavatus (strain ATCC 1007 / CBS 513.65 / DSM 816 / NCTC 3887 / NRRL 1 / QM 1276 / 107) TaxID=344612 RepID=A1CGR3_ASPCL|nr:uncharacterized protein ACLA_045330 [Aspergillus clavatus NRRL 1]EAW10068.1 conserved hypothetical protein [Aspergillus clavatus NRRL 1]